MPSIQVIVPHELAPSEAGRRLREHAEAKRDSVADQVSNICEEWDDNGNLDFSLQFMKLSISGRMECQPGQVVINTQIPFAALPFRGLIEKELTQRLNEALDA